MNLTVEYKFKSMNDLADYIETKALEARERTTSSGKRTQRYIANMAAAQSFEIAASIVRQSTIVGE